MLYWKLLCQEFCICSQWRIHWESGHKTRLLQYIIAPRKLYFMCQETLSVGSKCHQIVWSPGRHPGPRYGSLQCSLHMLTMADPLGVRS